MRTTLKNFIARHGIQFKQEWVDSRPDGLMDDRGQNHYKCLIQHAGRRMTAYFSMGSGLHHEPTLPEVLDCLASDAASYENANGFEDWSGEYGYAPDSRPAEKIWKAVARNSFKLGKLLGDDVYKQLLWETERML